MLALLLLSLCALTAVRHECRSREGADIPWAPAAQLLVSLMTGATGRAVTLVARALRAAALHSAATPRP